MAAAEAWVPVEVGQVLSQTNNGQGDCLFVAISQQLDGVMSSQALRQMAVAYLTDHREDLYAELLSLGWDMLETGEILCVLEGDLLVDAVLQVLANPWVWGGAECIAALGLALNREIRVYEENGPTIMFPRGDDSLPPIRLLLRYPWPGGRRLTHYESVLAWRPDRSIQSRGVSTSSTCDMGTQTLPEQVSIPEDPHPAPSQSVEASESCSLPQPLERSSRVLRPRHSSLQCSQPEPIFRSEDFSDEEECSPETRNNPEESKYILCISCGKNIGRYTLLYCGCFPVCGRCIGVWYVRIKDVPCPRCGKRVIGWTKVLNNN